MKKKRNFRIHIFINTYMPNMQSLYTFIVTHTSFTYTHETCNVSTHSLFYIHRSHTHIEYIYAYTYTYTYAHIHTFIHIHKLCIYIKHTYTNIHTQTCILMHKWMHTYTHTYMYKHITRQSIYGNTHTDVHI